MAGDRNCHVTVGLTKVDFGRNIDLRNDRYLDAFDIALSWHMYFWPLDRFSKWYRTDVRIVNAPSCSHGTREIERRVIVD